MPFPRLRDSLSGCGHDSRNLEEKYMDSKPEFRVEDALDAEPVPSDFHDGGVRRLELRRQVHLGAWKNHPFNSTPLKTDDWWINDIN